MSLLTVKQSHRKILASGSDEELWLKVDIEAPARKSQAKRAPADVVLVIDCSGSMGSCTPQWQTTYEEEWEEDDPYQPSPWPVTPNPFPVTPTPYPGPYWNVNGPSNAIGITQGTHTGMPLQQLIPPRPVGRKKVRRRYGYRPTLNYFPTPLDNALKAAREVLGRLSKDDRAAVVLYDDNVKVIHSLSHDHQAAIGKLQFVQMGGMTALADALYKGIDMLAESGPDRARMVFLLSDGQANVGETSPDRIGARVAKASANGVRISTFGLGSSFNEFLMEGIAKAGKGTYRYLASAEAAVDAFGGELSDLFAVTAQNVSLDIKPAEGVRIERLLGLDADGPSVDVGDIPAKAQRTVLVCLQTKTGAKAAELPLAEIAVSWTGEGQKRAKRELVSVTVKTSRSEKQVQAGIDAEVLADVAALQAAEAQVQAAAFADQGDMLRAQSTLTCAMNASSSMLAMAPDSALLASKVGELEGNLSSLASYDSASAKQFRYQSYRTRNSR